MTTSENDTQDNPLHGPNLILDVENFGPIAEAKNIEFKPMTVFVGPSNTGKTYLAILTHALLRARNEGVPAQSNLAPIRELGFPIIEQDSLRNFASELQTIIRSLQPSSQPESFNTMLWIGVNGFSNESRDFLQKHIDDNVRLTSARYKVLIQEYFEVDSIETLSNFSTIHNNNPSIRWTETGGHLKISPDVRVASCDILDTKFAIAFDLENLLRHYSVDEFPEIRRELLSSIGDYVESILDNLVLSHYFPTGRSGIMNGRHVLASHLTARDQNYNLLARDFLSSLVAVRAIWNKPIFPSRKSSRIRRSLATNVKIGHVASVIEESILKGRVHIEETLGLPEFFFRQEQGRVLMTSASSMVTDLAPIVMFLRSFVQVGDLLIIDEPEAHLHPEAQQQMAAALAFMVRSGLRILITTHSHYMVEQLSAFVNASKLDEATRKRTLALGGALGKEDIYLNEEETAVYNFRFSPEHGGSVVEEVFMGDEFEYGTDDHTDAVTDQFNRLQRVLEAREKVEFGELD